jgi:prepilin peptidase CpaA
MLEVLVLTIFPMAMLISASMDLLTMTIPNKVTLALVAGFFLLAPFIGLGWNDFAIHIGVAFGLLLIGMFMFAMGWIGGGDAKLFAATGLWLGYSTQMFEYALYASLLGGVLTLAILKLRALPVLPRFMNFSWLWRLHNPDEGVPYGLALAVSGLMIYPHSIWIKGVL